MIVKGVNGSQVRGFLEIVLMLRVEVACKLPKNFVTTAILVKTSKKL